MNALLLNLVVAAVAPPYQPTAPPYVAPAVGHVDQPITKPATVAHARSYDLGDRCEMCVGNHCINMHEGRFDMGGYRSWSAYHAKLHDAMGTPQPSGCPGGVCPTRPIRRLFGGWR